MRGLSLETQVYDGLGLRLEIRCSGLSRQLNSSLLVSSLRMDNKTDI